MTWTELGHFFIIGAQRSGTTRLCQDLDSHPDISMALPHHPEPQWFLRQLSWNDVHAYREKHFLNDPIVKWLGEKSTSYLERPETAKYIKSTCTTFRVAFAKNVIF